MKANILIFVIILIILHSCKSDDDGLDLKIGELSEGDIIITEIMFNPVVVADENGEWFEIYNTSSTDTYNLQDVIVSNTTTEFKINTELLIAPNSFLIFGENKDNDSNGNINVNYLYQVLVLRNNVPDNIALTLNTTIIDEALYVGSFHTNPEGKSISLNPNHFNHIDNDNLSNWCLSTNKLDSGDYGTPNEWNTGCE